MNLANLIPLLLLVLALFLAFWMVFKKDLPSKGLLHVLWYLVGVLLIFFFALWMFGSIVPGWINTTLQGLVVNQDVNQFQDTTRRILDTSFAGGPRLGTPSASLSISNPNPNPVVTAPTAAPAVPVVAPTSASNPLPTATNMPISLPPGNNTSSAGASGAVVNHEYTVQPGDTLFTIARKLGVSMTDLQNANGLLNPNMLQVGQKLRVP